MIKRWNDIFAQLNIYSSALLILYDDDDDDNTSETSLQFLSKHFFCDRISLEQFFDKLYVY